MKKLLILAFGLILVGCMQPLTNEEIVKEIKYCQDNGMSVNQLVNINGVIGAIQCSKPDETQD
jgi:uncharacterized lipoprotein YajG